MQASRGSGSVVQATAIVLGLLALLAAGPGAGARARDEPASPTPEPGGAESPFPTPETLEDLAETPLPEGAFRRSVATVDAWTLEGPFPEQVAAERHRDPSPWGGLLEAAASRRAGLVLPTAAMYCAAREWGRFWLAHRAQPSAVLVSFIGGRCGASTAHVGFQYFEGGVPETASDEDIFEAWRASVESLVAEQLVGGPRVAGVWYGRQEGRAIVVIASGERLVHVEPLPQVLGGDGSFTVRGEVLVQAAAIEAAVNRGRFGTAVCEADEKLALPRFAFRCQADPADPRTWLTVTLVPPGRLLGRGALGVVLFPSAGGQATGAEWRRPSVGEPVPVGPETDVRAEITALVNRVRAEAGVGPLSLSDPQSEVAERLAPYYFASAFGVTPPQAGDLVVLGLLAGWSIEGIVQAGHFSSSFVLSSLDLDHLVATAVEYPPGRRALLAEEVRHLAVGSVVRSEDDFLAAVFGSYALFDEASQEQFARQVLEALDAARAVRGKAPARHLVEIASLSRLAAGRVQGGEAPLDVLQDLLQQGTRVLGRSTNGWALEAREIASLEFPEELLTRDALEIAIGVSHHKPAGEPWGRYVVLIVAPGQTGRGT